MLVAPCRPLPTPPSSTPSAAGATSRPSSTPWPPDPAAPPGSRPATAPRRRRRAHLRRPDRRRVHAHRRSPDPRAGWRSSMEAPAPQPDRRRILERLRARRDLRAGPAVALPGQQALLDRGRRRAGAAARRGRRARSPSRLRAGGAGDEPPRPPERHGHVVGKPPREIFAGFEDVDPDERAGRRRRQVPPRRHGATASPAAAPRSHLTWRPTRSHLEAVDPVVVGPRARQAATGAGRTASREVVPVMVHGDAAFAGQGMVAETSTSPTCPATRSAARSTSWSTT